MTGRVVVAGGSGMVGRHLARTLLEAGSEVAILSRNPPRTQERLPAGSVAMGWDGTVTAALVAALDGAAAVVNLAGEAIGPRPWTAGRKLAIRDSRLRATNALVGAIARLPEARRPAVLANASGTDVYAGLDAEPATESTRPADDFLARVCVDWEAAARAAEPLGTRVVIVRQAFVLARDAPVLALLALPFRLFLGGRLGSGRQWFSWIHVADLAAIYRRAIVDPTMRGTLNAAAPTPSRYDELATFLGHALGRPSWLPVPSWAIRLALGEESTLVLESRRAVPARLEALGFEFSYPDLELALRDVLGPSESGRGSAN